MLALRRERNKFLEPIAKAVQQLLTAIENARANDEFRDPQVFRDMIGAALKHTEFKGSDLSKDLGISKGSISKWISGDATPNYPTRNAVADWIINQCRMMLTDN